MKYNFLSIKKQALRIGVRKKRKTKRERGMSIISFRLHNKIDNKVLHIGWVAFCIKNELYNV